MCFLATTSQSEAQRICDRLDAGDLGEPRRYRTGDAF
jgi:hypothetical protein